MRWGDLRESGRPAGLDRLSVRGRSAVGTAPGPPRSLPLTTRPGQSLPFTPRAVVLTCPLLAPPGAFSVWGASAQEGSVKQTQGRASICQGLKAAPGFRRVSPGVHTKPVAILAPCTVPGSLGHQGSLYCGGPVPASAEPASKVDSHSQKHKAASNSLQGEGPTSRQALPR